MSYPIFSLYSKSNISLNIFDIIQCPNISIGYHITKFVLLFSYYYIFFPITTILQSSPFPLSQVDNISICSPYLGLFSCLHKLCSSTLSMNSSCSSLFLAITNFQYSNSCMLTLITANTSYSLFLSVVKYIFLCLLKNSLSYLKLYFDLSFALTHA